VRLRGTEKWHKASIDALLTREFLDLGGERQVLRVLRELTDDGKLIRLGYGVYGRAEISPITKQPMLAGDGFNAVARRALDKLNVRWEPPTRRLRLRCGGGASRL
jgi:hypothetical protein